MEAIITVQLLGRVFKLPKNAAHFLVIWSLLLALLLDIGVAYRSLAYINIVFVIYYAAKLDNFKNTFSKKLIYLLMCPVIFLILHLVLMIEP